MKVIEDTRLPKTTAECVELISDYNLIPYIWKRTTKLKFGDIEVRVFKNEDDEFVTIVTEKNSQNLTKIFENLNFSELVPIINEIKKQAKFYYTFDYGSVYLNPYTLDLYISASDGGYGYSTEPKSKLQREIDNDELDFDEMENHFVEFNDHDGLEMIKSVEWEAESSPEEAEFIEICNISTFN
jgi:hypothetical protein